MRRAPVDVGPASTVVLAISPQRALPLAKEFAERGCAPVLAFSRYQLASFGNCADILIADHDVDPCGETLLAIGESSATIRMFIANESRVEPLDVHAHVSPDAVPKQIVAQALALIALRQGAPWTSDMLSWGALELYPATRESRWYGEPIDLTATQFDILAALVRSGGAVLTKTELQREVWPDAPPDDGERLIAHIRRIRARIEKDPSRPEFLLTARGVGFRLADPEADRRRNLMLVSNARKVPTSEIVTAPHLTG